MGRGMSYPARRAALPRMGNTRSRSGASSLARMQRGRPQRPQFDGWRERPPRHVPDWQLRGDEHRQTELSSIGSLNSPSRVSNETRSNPISASGSCAQPFGPIATIMRTTNELKTETLAMFLIFRNPWSNRSIANLTAANCCWRFSIVPFRSASSPHLPSIPIVRSRWSGCTGCTGRVP